MPRSKKFASASAFIRAMPRSVPAKSVVAAAAKYGFKISDQLVYNVRSQDAAKGRPAGRKRPSTVTRSDLTPGDAALIRAAAEVGLERARELLGRLERALGSSA
jgi:hypothetical protein